MKYYLHRNTRTAKKFLVIIPVVAAMTVLGLFPAGVSYAAEETEPTVGEEQFTEDVSVSDSTVLSADQDMPAAEISAEEDADAGTDTESEEPVVKNGWYDEEGGKHYYINGEMVTESFQTIEGSVYYFDANGLVKTGLFAVGNNNYYADVEGALLKNQMITATDPWYFMGSDGAALKNTIVSYNGKYYYTDKSTGAVNRGTKWIDLDGKKYYATMDGTLYRNQTWSGKNTYYFGNDCAMVKGAILKLDGKTVYARKSDGGINRAYGQINLNGKIYFSKSGGQLYMNEVVPDRDGIPLYYMDGNGNPIKGKVFAYNGNYYYARKSDGGVNRGKGWIDLNGKKYYSPPGGKLYRNQTWSGKNTYYFGNDAAMVKGAVIKLNGAYYYFRKSDGGMNRAAGWFETNGKKYYSTSGGKVAYNQWVKIGNKWNHFNTNFTVDKTSDKAPLDAMGQKAQSYSSSSSYLILVNRDDHIVKIYSGSKWNWTQIKSFSCGNGKASTPTITGEFSIPSKYPRSHPYFDSGSARCWYPTRIYGGYLFHSILYYQTGSPSRVMDGRLGVGVSHGCIRLALDNAKWIYDNIPLGTKVVIY